MGNFLGIERVVEIFRDDDRAAERPKHAVRQWEDHLRVKVRMTKRELRELMAKVDIIEDEDGDLKVNEGRDHAELGRLIMKGGLEGRYQACVVVPFSSSYTREPKKSV